MQHDTSLKRGDINTTNKYTHSLKKEENKLSSVIVTDFWQKNRRHISFDFKQINLQIIYFQIVPF